MNNSIKENNILFFVILGMVTILFLFLLMPFFFPIFWVAVIVGVFRPLYVRINRKLSRPNLSTAILFLLIALIILLPLGIVETLVFNESVQFYATLNPDARHMDRNLQHLMDTISGNSIANLFHVNKEMLVAKTTEVVQGITNYIFVHLSEITQSNLLRPILIGQDVEMHRLLIFLSTLGGIMLFGFSGFVVGPVTTSLLTAI